MVGELYRYLSGTGSTVDVTGGTAAEACILPQLVLHYAGANVCAVSCSWQQAAKMQIKRMGTWRFSADLKGTAS